MKPDDPNAATVRSAAQRVVGSALVAAAAMGSTGAAPADEPAAARPPARSSLVLDVREFGARGDGATLETAAIQAAIDRAADAGGGEVLLPPGVYLSGTIELRSGVTLRLAEKARLRGTDRLEAYRAFAPPEGTFEARLGKWHRALVLADSAEDVAIVGPGMIDGGNVTDPTGEEKRRGPHTVLLGRCRRAALRDLTIRGSGNYAVMLEWSEEVELRDVKILGGYDGVHFRASADRPCRDLAIVDCSLATGDDAIAGRYLDRLRVEGCEINSSCNGVRIIGPVRDMVLKDCRFEGPGRHAHRTSGRRDMLSGVLLQPGAWDPCPGALEGVTIDDVTMKNVASPVSIYLRREGNTIDRVRIERLEATGVWRAAASVESWTGQPVGSVTLSDVKIEYVGGGTKTQSAEAAKPPGLDCRALPAWGFYARNVRQLRIERTQLRCAKPDGRHVALFEQVEDLRTEAFDVPVLGDAAEPVRRILAAPR